MLLLAGAKFVLIWCFFFQNGAPSWCKFCAHLVLLFLKMVLLAGAKFVLIWRFFPQNGAPIWCKICAHLAFFLQNGAPSWCKICSCCRSSAVEKENDLGWLKKWCFSGAFLWSSWCKICAHLVQNVWSSGAFFLQNCFVAAAKRGGGWRWMYVWRMWVDVEWRGGVAQGELAEKLAQVWSNTKKMTTAAVYADHFGVSLPLFFFE